MSSIRSDFIFLSVSQYIMFIFALFFPRKKGKFFKNFQLGFFVISSSGFVLIQYVMALVSTKALSFQSKRNAARESHSGGARDLVRLSTASRNFQTLIIRSFSHNLFLNLNETFFGLTYFSPFPYLIAFGMEPQEDKLSQIIKFSLYYH